MTHRVDPSRLERLYRTFEEHPLLRIDELCFAGAVLEVLGIEHFEIGQRGAGPDEGWQLEDRIGDADVAQLVVAEKRDRFDAILQVRPELGNVLGAWTTNGHADDGNAW